MGTRIFLLSLVAGLTLVFPAAGLAEKKDGPWRFHGVIVHGCHDGDTCTVTLRGRHPLFGRNARVRLLGIDAPETGGRAKCVRERELGLKAKEMLLALLTGAERVNLVGVLKMDSFGRILGRLTADGVDVGARLIRAGLARAWKERARGWC